MKFIIVLLWAMLVASPVFAQEAKSNSLFDLINIETFPVARVNVTGDSAQNADFQQFHDSKRFLRLGFEFTTDFGLEVNLNLDITQGITANKKNPLFLNIPFAPGIGLTGFIDTHTPFESYVAYEGDLIDLSVGRRRWAMGAGDYSLSVGSHAPWFDGMWFNLHPTLSGHRFDWTFLVAADTPIFISTWNEGNSAHSSYYWDTDADKPLLNSWAGRYFLMHNTSIWGNTWKFSIGETALVVGNLDLYTGNPTSIWHSVFLGHVNIEIQLAFEKRIAEQWRVYSELLLDDLPLEGGLTNPLSGAFTLGADYQLFPGTERYTGPVQNPLYNIKREDNLRFSGGLVLSAQFVLTSRYVYSRADDEAIERFTMTKNVGAGDFFLYEHYIGFEYGPDTFLTALSAKWENKSFFVTGNLAFMLRGEFGVNDQKQAEARSWTGFTKQDGGASDWFFSDTLAGVQFVATVEGWYALRKNLSAYARLQTQLTNITNYDNRFLFETGVLFKL
ncbi:hypothetical protein FACS1894172_12090 [Spirochaetia bacterium]|nr:hypothetical protein FACS1894164_01860 [Spirochaetia bacterium]GHU33481.1 hypothetical protein FACS1894172_12090 [Spirochaetia bacterium]